MNGKLTTSMTEGNEDMHNKDLYNELCRNALQYDRLYHYTSLEALDIILANRSLRLSSLIKVNDPQENKRITSIWNKKVFVACFTNTLDNSDYFFANYGKVRITFLNKIEHSDIFFDSTLKFKVIDFHLDCKSESDLEYKSYSNDQDWCLFDVSFADVYYTNDLDFHISSDGFESNAGLIKQKSGIDNKGISRDWSVEKESRLRVAVRPIALEAVSEGNDFKYPKPPFDYLYISIKNLIVKIELCDLCASTERIAFDKIIEKYGY